MRAQIHPGGFLAGCAALSAAWLWLRPPAPTPQFGAPSSAAAGAARPTAVRAAIHVDAATLERYAGRYSAEGLAVVITVDGERLVVQAEGLPTYGLRATTEVKFFFEDFPGEITFDAGEPAPGFVADLADGRHYGTRIR